MDRTHNRTEYNYF